MLKLFLIKNISIMNADIMSIVYELCNKIAMKSYNTSMYHCFDLDNPTHTDQVSIKVLYISVDYANNYRCMLCDKFKRRLFRGIKIDSEICSRNYGMSSRYDKIHEKCYIDLLNTCF
jgi:hypothetical protein